MTTIQNNTARAQKKNKEPDQPPKQADLGWEGHVHFPTGIPLWRRVLENWPELRTGLAYSLVFASGVLLGSGVTALLGSRRTKTQK